MTKDDKPPAQTGGPRFKETDDALGSGCLILRSDGSAIGRRPRSISTGIPYPTWSPSEIGTDAEE